MSYSIAIPSLGRAEILKTQTLETIKSIPNTNIYIFVVDYEYEIYKKLLPNYNIIIGHKGVVEQRQFISMYFPINTHILYLDDDIQSIDLSLTDHNSLDEFINYAFANCINLKSFIWGVYPVFNPFFRKERQSINTSLTLLVGCFYGLVNRHLHLKTIVSYSKEDVCRSIQYFINDGIVVRYERVGFKTKYYNSIGGIGSLKDRMPDIINDVINLKKEFPCYGKVKIRKNGIHEFVLNKLNANTDKQIQQLVLVSSSEFSSLKIMLDNISIPFKVGTSGRHGFAKHRATLFGISKGRYNGITGLSNLTNKYPNIYNELLRIGLLICPFEFNSIYVNYNVTCPKHIDGKNQGKSCLVSFGEYIGGKLVIDGTIYDANCSPIVFNGSTMEHWNTDDLVGDKYSLVYFNNVF
jgi:hypothetical protein